MVTPTRMPMTMHMFGAMFGAMFAPSGRITLMAMLPFISSAMDHSTRAGGSFTTESPGMGDIKVGAMIGLADWANQSLHLNAMADLPTGSIDKMDVLPNSQGMEVQLPYPMQIGSGTPGGRGCSGATSRPGFGWSPPGPGTSTGETPRRA